MNKINLNSSYAEILNAIDRASLQGYCILDIHTNQIKWVSEKMHSFLGDSPIPSESDVSVGDYKKYLSKGSVKVVEAMLRSLQERMRNSMPKNVSDVYFTFSLELILPHRRPFMSSIRVVPIKTEKSGSVDEILCAISLSTRQDIGHLYVGEVGSAQRVFMPLDGSEPKQQNFPHLSIVEKETLQLSAQGYKNEEIANFLCRSVEAIKKIKSSIFKKTKAKNITESVLYCVTHHLFWHDFK